MGLMIINGWLDIENASYYLLPLWLRLLSTPSLTLDTRLQNQ